MNNEKAKDKGDNFYSKNKKYILTAAGVAIAISLGAGGYYFTVKNKVESWSNKIYPGTKIEGVDVSGMTSQEASDLLNNSFGKKILDKKLVVSADGKTVEIKFNELSPEYNIDNVVNEALKFGKQESIFKQNSFIKNGANNSLELHFKYNNEKLYQYEEMLKNEVNKDAKDASVNISNGHIKITDGVEGKKIDEDQMTTLIEQAIDGKIQEVVNIEVPVYTIQPKITTEMLSKINGVLGSFTSDYSHNSTDNRAMNVYLSTKAINGTLLMPGDTFSFNTVVGPRTAARGYKDAATFVGNKVVDGLGGGICQTSTAINRAVIRAGLKPTERMNHSMKTSYSEYGLDSAVAWGSLDYKFVNTYDSPIYIEGITTSNRRIIFNIYGNTANKGGKTYELVATPAEMTDEAKIKKVEDPNLEKGKEEWEVKPVNAYKSSSSIVVYENGKEIKREFLATHKYVKADGVLKIGTKVIEKPAPEQPITPEEQPTTPPEQSTTPSTHKG